MKFIISKMGIILLSVFLLCACSPTELIDDDPQNVEEDNDIIDVVEPDEPEPPTEPDIVPSTEPDISEPIEPDVSEPVESDVSEPVEPDIPKPQPTVNYQDVVDDYLSEDIVYYNVVNNLLYRQDTEKTRCYPADVSIEDMGRITDEILSETANAIGCDTTDENYKFLLADYKVSYAIYNGKLYRYFYEEDYLEVIYENEKLCYAQFYTNKCVTIALYSKKWYDYIDEITSLGYKSAAEADANDYYFLGNHIGDIITIDLITGEETLLEGRTDVYGDPYSEIDGDFPGVITIE